MSKGSPSWDARYEADQREEQDGQQTHCEQGDRSWAGVSPRPGGEADKLGNKYELAWAIRHALYCILDEERSITLEDIDPDLANGSEFTFVTSTGTVTVHQLKRQHGNSNYWRIGALADRKIFEAASKHVASGREYHFGSHIPCGPLKALCERARKSADLTEFTQRWLTDELREAFDELSAAKIFGSPAQAWVALRGMWFEIHDEDDVVHFNSVLAELCLDGTTGHLAALAIGDILLDNLGPTLTRRELLEALAMHGIRPRAASARQSSHEEIAAVTASWRGTITRELLDPPIERAEGAELVDVLGDIRVALVVGSAGGGKSSVLEQAVGALERNGAEVLAFRLDRLDAFASTVELGRQLGLTSSPTAALALAANDRDAYLVIDQLDAVSLASGRMSERYDVIADSISEALSIAGMHVVLACRQFDVENDHRIRQLDARPDVHTLKVEDLPDEAVTEAVSNMGLDAASLTASQRTLPRTPLHLVLLSGIATQPDALAFYSKGSLFEAFWERKRQTARQRRSTVRFNEVLSRVANAASDRQTLSVPIELFDADDLIEDALVLISEQVLARDGDRVAFFHEAFFDYAFARQWVTRSESLVEFLGRHEQELFRRAQVRQILQLLHEREPERFRSEVEAVLSSPDIRFHIKETVIAVLANVPAPTGEDAALVLRVAGSKPSFEGRLWQQLRRPEWFRRLHEQGVIARWMDGDDQDLKERAVAFMASGVKVHGSIVAGLLSERRDAPGYLAWLRWLAQVSDLHQNRMLFELLLEAVRDGGFDGKDQDLWLTAHELGPRRPLWAIELLQARFIDHHDALALADDGEIAALKKREYGAAELIREAANAEPLVFIQAVLPFLLDVMAATELPEHLDAPLRDRHFGMRFPEMDGDERQVDDALLNACVDALEILARTSPDAVRPLLQRLADDPHDAAQYLLYRALTAGEATFADWAAELLLAGEARLDCGYASDGDWVARELVKAIAPHLSDETHAALEELLRDLGNPYEHRYSFGRSAFTFLSALEEQRLSPVGIRRLGEYRRKFGEVEPPKPRGMIAGIVGSPIGTTAADRMSDEQWLRAMVKHDGEQTDWGSLTGGARELSHVLRQRVADDPGRFARLALRLTSDLNPAYADGILMGLGDATPGPDDMPLVFDAIRHIAGLGLKETDRWLGWALRRLYRETPLDLIELVRDRALNSPDPADDRPVFTREGDDRRAKYLRENGINTARGSLAEALGDLLVYDVAGERTELVRPHLPVLANDPVLSVRSCVAHTIAATLRHARSDAYGAFEQLIDADDALLASDMVRKLMIYIGNVNPERIDPVIIRMLASTDDEVRQAGGSMAAVAALQWDRPTLMEQALSGDAKVRKGAARVCGLLVDRTSNVELATESLKHSMYDEDDDVRKAAAEVAMHLRDQPLRPFAGLLLALMDSPSYDHATPQLLLTLQHAPDKVDDLVLKASQRFLSVSGADAADIRTGAAGDAHYISELVVRGLAQSRDRAHRAALLDVLDRLLELGVYGIGDAIADSERL